MGSASQNAIVVLVARRRLDAGLRPEGVGSRFPFPLQSPSIEPLSAMSQTAQKGQVPPGFCDTGLRPRGRNERRNLSPKSRLSPKLGTARISLQAFPELV